MIKRYNRAAALGLCDTLKSEKFQSSFKNKIEKHKELYKQVKVSGVMFEEILVKSLSEMSQEVPVWNYGSHAVGADIEYNGVKISCKSGTVKNNQLIISGSRTSSYKTLEEKLNFLAVPHDDIMITLSRVDDNYKMFCIESANIQFGSINNWEATNSGWKYKCDFFDSKIVKKMSDQVWMYFKADHENITLIGSYKS